MKRYFKYSVLFVFLFAVSCKTGKETASVALPSMTAEERLSSIIQSGIQYDDLSSSLKLTVRPGKMKKELSVDAQLRIVKNEAVQISLRMPFLGTEVFRIVITPDKVVIIDRLNKQYLSENIPDIKSQIAFDFDYYSLEALLTNQLFIAGKKEISPADYVAFQLKEDKFNAHITYSDRQRIRYDFETDYTNRIQMARMEQPTGESYLQCNYTDWGLTSNNRLFPMTLRFQVHTPGDVYDLNWFCKSVVVNTGVVVDYTIPDKYQQVSLQQVFRLIKELL